MSTNNITDYIKVETINLDLKGKNKNAVIKELYEGLKETNIIKNPELGLNDIFSREEMGTTGIGKEVAVPHAKTTTVNELIITIGISKDGVEYGTLEDEKEKVKIIFMFLCPVDDTKEYLRVLARISRVIKEDRFRENLLKAKTQEEIMEIIKSEEV